MFENFPHPDRLVGDTVSLAAIVGTFLGYLPAIASLGAAVWYAIQIWESDTVQRLRSKKNDPTDFV